MIFKLEIETDNAAFDGPDTRDYEVARILRVAAMNIERGYDAAKCLDFNGNVVGNYRHED